MLLPSYCIPLFAVQVLAWPPVIHPERVKSYHHPHRITAQSGSGSGSLNTTTGTLPILTLPYGSWQAYSYDTDADLYLFRNIRFAAPPVGDLRFAGPAPPRYNSSLQKGSYGPTCIGGGLQALAQVGAALTGTSTSSLTGALSGLSGLDPTSPLAGLLGLNAAEDCLFLDIYVPSKALNGSGKLLPVINWIYGGAYIGGSKEGLYEGTPLVKQSGGNVIYVVGNYRLAAFGFLGGTTVEREGTPNAAFYDQRAVLEWLQKYIHLVGGDRNRVSAWGESAGAGSIEHHLTQFGGRRDPLFRKAIIQSPAFVGRYDRKGSIEDTYKQFEAAAGCEGLGLSCLRKQTTAVLNNASTLVINTAASNTFGWGPVADGRWVRQVPALEFASGNYWHDIDSLILSHVSNEAQIFVNPNITTNAGATAFLQSVYPNADPAVIAAIEQQYPPVTNTSPSVYNSTFDRLRAITQDSTFTCNVRYLTDAYRGRTYNAQYSRASGLHGTDIGATFYDPDNFITTFLDSADKTIGSFAPTYQSYLTSHARTGDPNSFAKGNGNFSVIELPKVVDGEQLAQVLYVGNEGYSLFSDEETRRDTCEFWVSVAAALTDEAGYAPPGAVVPTTIKGIVYDLFSASRNYISGWSWGSGGRGREGGHWKA